MRGMQIVIVFVFGVASVSPAADEPPKSGPQPGDSLPGVFEPINVNGAYAGQRHCLVCENGLNPVVMIFARDVSDPLLQLIGKLDAATAKNRACEMGSFVVFLNDKEGLDKQLETAAKKQSLKHTILAIDAPAGPDGFKIAKDAEITVVLYEKHDVKANHAFKKGQLTNQAIDKILADLPKILPKK